MHLQSYVKQIKTKMNSFVCVRHEKKVRCVLALRLQNIKLVKLFTARQQ